MKTHLIVFICYVLLIPACGPGGTLPQKTGVSVNEPAQPIGKGTFSISAVGGEGVSGNGGNGGEFEVIASEIRMVRDGSFDTTFTLPITTKNMGNNPRRVDEDITIDMNDGITSSCPDQLTGDDGNTNASGLEVVEKFTLILLADPDCQGVVSIRIQGDIIIKGTIRTGPVSPGSPDHAGLFLGTKENIVAGPESLINTSGNDSSTGPGGSGGSFDIDVSGLSILQGIIQTTGGNAIGITGTGGNGGNTAITSGLTIHNTGIIFTSGGLAVIGSGGTGGSVKMEVSSTQAASVCSGSVGIFNEGAITTSGGNGSIGGGKAQNIALTVKDCTLGGDLINSGSLTAIGGDATSIGNGGDGAKISLSAIGQLLETGTMNANGGSGSVGGIGGIISITNSILVIGGRQSPNNNVQIATSISADGGSGNSGGSANLLKSTITATGLDLHLIEFTSVHLEGGDTASGTGGTGGQISIMGSDTTSPLLGLRNELDIFTSGGNGSGSNGLGGPGGNVTVQTEIMANFGKIVMDGGSGVVSGGDAGIGSFQISKKFFNDDELSAHGGTGSLTTAGTGGTGGEINITADLSIKNNGNIDVSGGDGALKGGDAGKVMLGAIQRTTNSASISSQGGNASKNLASSTGGDGGSIEIDTQKQTSLNSGTLSTIKGKGSVDSNAADGTITVDGNNI